jgi:hypothetical protein
MSKSLKREFRKLWLRLLPRRVWCALHGRHRWGQADPVITDGPLDLPPRERDWAVLAFHRQCERCYKVADVVYSFVDAETAVREAIEEDERELDE